MALFGNTTTIRLDVQDMTCANCVKHVKAALESVDGVKKAQVDLDQHQAQVKARPDADIDRMLAAVDAAGYTATRHD